MLVRCFYWIAWINQGTPTSEDDFGMPLSIRAFFITYPQINVLICSFLIQYPWLYDFILIQNGRQINLILRQQMKMFVVAAIIFSVLMYIVFAFGFPITDDSAEGKLPTLFNTIMVFSIISAILVLCQVMSGARRIEAINPTYGKYLKYQGLVFLANNVVTSFVYHLFATQKLLLINFNVVTGTLFQLAFFGVSELMPLCSFVYVT
jgi:hypothetical protein